MIEEYKHWQINSPITPEAEKALHGYPPLLQQILFNRGYATHEEARSFLECKEPPGTSPLNLRGIQETVDRILTAIQKKENIVIYGDYDVDGVTATATLLLYLRSMGGFVESYIPNRFDEGYGLNIDAITSLKEHGTDLIITVDCGIRSLEEANHARRIGLDLIISDHHHPGEELPSAIAIIDPKQQQDSYPEKDLAGVGIAYKIIEALSNLTEGENINPKEFLDLVALGTVADLAPLVGENRFLVREGLKYIQKPNRQGILSLIGVAGLNPKRITASDIGFILGPRLNAAGRLGTANLALELLVTNDVQRSGYIAQQLDNFNRDRQRITKDIQNLSDELISSSDPEALLVFAVHPNFNPGVVGLAASRLTDRYYRPSIVGYKGDDFTRASCRSITEFHITKALDQCSDLLEYYGGHAAAAGFTVKNKNLEELSDRLKLIAEEQLAELDLRPTINVDAEIQFAEIDHQITDYLKWLQPTGYGNPSAIFASRNLRVKKYRTVGKENSHLKLTVNDGGITIDGIAFRQGYWNENLPKYIDLVFNLEINEFRGQRSLQLNIKDIKPSNLDI